MMEPFVTNRYIYGPYGEPLHYDNEKERQGFIGKEKDIESGLADHGVRKYDYISGRFTSTDPLWEKYMGFTPYQYSANNPVGLLDDNGKWFWCINGDKYQDNKTWSVQGSDGDNYSLTSANINAKSFQEQANGLINEYRSSAPAVADFMQNNSIKLLSVEGFENSTGGVSSIGNLSDPIFINNLSKEGKLKEEINLKSSLFHETIHKMGGSEFQAFAAGFAAGIFTKEFVINLYKNNRDYLFKGMPLSLGTKIFKRNYGTIDDFEDFINKFKEYGTKINNGTINPKNIE